MKPNQSKTSKGRKQKGKARLRSSDVLGCDKRYKKHQKTARRLSNKNLSCGMAIISFHLIGNHPEAAAEVMEASNRLYKAV